MKIREVVTDPGVLFSVANIFMFMQSGSFAALAYACCIASLTITAACCAAAGKKRLLPSPLRINAWGGLGGGLFSLAAGSLLPGFAGLAFSTGNFLAASTRVQNFQHEPQAPRWLKALTHAAVYFGIGYALIGLMAGGGTRLLENPLDNIPALVATCLGVTATTLSSIGIVSGAFPNPAAPFMAVVAGSFINIWAGIFSGNLIGAVNNFFAMAGEFRLAWDADIRHNASANAATGALSVVSDVLMVPLRAARKYFA